MESISPKRNKWAFWPFLYHCKSWGWKLLATKDCHCKCSCGYPGKSKFLSELSDPKRHIIFSNLNIGAIFFSVLRNQLLRRCNNDVGGAILAFIYCASRYIISAAQYLLMDCAFSYCAGAIMFWSAQSRRDNWRRNNVSLHHKNWKLINLETLEMFFFFQKWRFWNFSYFENNFDFQNV